MTKLIGITGGIASGKTTLVNMVRQAGYEVIDADSVVHDLQAKGGKLYEALVDTFGSEILQADGELNRIKLAEMVFSNPENRAISSRIQDQIIREELKQRRDDLLEKENILFMDIPLLIELGYQDWFDDIWLVDVTPETQLKRLMARNHLTLSQANQRIASQLPLSAKRPYASLLIDNNKDLPALEKQVREALHKLSYL
ncbi:dephospho-CoA kinase [Streptococcus phocae subsp. salmonis]|uniref:dephospho-CoA kinase n=1 Tax=Streptococcus phocae TaxID=119224 RepID=UPI000531750A|nr:dephospho-CoA kinase [Streptococcus phocae]KGR72133.1 dephospho-CoA kinase [Streptococcus phocae subsp. salmonis]